VACGRSIPPHLHEDVVGARHASPVQ
jgi:hypothetical protein